MELPKGARKAPREDGASADRQGTGMPVPSDRDVSKRPRIAPAVKRLIAAASTSHRETTRPRSPC